MEKKIGFKQIILLISCALILIVIFIIDVLTPIGYEDCFFYLIPTVLISILLSNRILIIQSFVCTLLIIAGALISPQTVAPVYIDVVNRGIAIMTLWIVVVILIVLTNTINRLRYSEELRVSQERFRSVFDSNMLAIAFWRSDGVLIEANNTFCGILGCSTEEILSGKVNLADYSVSEMHSRDQQCIDELKIKGFCTPFETKLVHHDGHIVPVLLGKAIINDTKDLGIVFCIDLTKQKEAEKELQESEERFRNLFENANDSIYIFDVENGKILDINNLASHTLGYSREELLGSSIDRIHSEGERDRINQLISNAKPGENIVDEHKHVKKDGSSIDVEMRGMLIDYGGKKAFHSISRNISDRKQLEEQLKQRLRDLSVAYKELESFSYSVAHDLRNPLRAISGFADFLYQDCSDKLDQDCNDYIIRIKEGTNRMNSIIDDLLALSKISRQEMETTVIDLSELAHLLFKELIDGNAGRKVEVKIQEGLRVLADRRLINVAMRNLIDNAWKYTSKIENPKIEFGAIEKDGKRIFFIKDNGAGFNMAYADKLFVPFQRLHAEKEFSGTGIGLAIVERAIARHGGTIWAESEPGRGATFFFTL